MLEKIQNFISEQKLFNSTDKLMLAVSGGADSVAMMHIMAEFGYSCAVGHVNHNLRPGDCDKDEQFVIEQAKKLGFEVLTKSFDVTGYAEKNKISIETAARNLRINTLVDFAKSLNCKKIVTAHHSDDNAETMIHRLLRGTAYRGLAGIWPSNDIAGFTFIRPMLCVNRAEIDKYINDNNLKFCHDHTNDEIDYTRNWIRHKLIPYLEADQGGSIGPKMAKLAGICRKIQKKWRQKSLKTFEKLAKTSENFTEFNVFDFNDQPEILKPELIRVAFEKLNIGLQKITNSHYSDIISVALAGKGSVNLPQGFKAYVENDRLVISPIECESPKPVELEIPGQTEFQDFIIDAKIYDASDCDLDKFIAEKELSVEWFDFEKIVMPLSIRLAKEGDKFIPLGRSTARKIGDFLPSKFIPIIVSCDNVIWISNSRPSEITKITDKTSKILQLSISCKKCLNSPKT